MPFKERGEAFLANNKRIAVLGVSRSGKDTGNFIYRKLKDEGYIVFPINPYADEVEGDRCYHSVIEIPDGVDGAIIATDAEITNDVVHDCFAAGVKEVWMHYNALFGQKNSSVSDEAVSYCLDHGMDVIDGGCPMMFFDPGHKCMRWVLDKFGKLPE